VFLPIWGAWCLRTEIALLSAPSKHPEASFEMCLATLHASVSEKIEGLVTHAFSLNSSIALRSS